MQTQLKDLIADSNRVVLENEIEPRYLSDALGRIHGNADALVFPRNVDEVSAVMAFAHEHTIPVTPRGAGTNLVGSTIPRGGIVLDFSQMNQILEIDEQTFTVTVDSGTTLEALQQFVEARGFFYPPDPGAKTATIGGNIATNAGGMRAVKYGVTRDYVCALEIVLADGTVTTLGSKNVKDASGLSLKNLIVGSEGTLGIITKCVLRILPKPQKSCSVLVAYDNLKQGISSVSKILHANANPTSIEFLERDAIELGEKFTGKKLPCQKGNATLLLTFDGSENAVSSNIHRARDVATNSSAVDFLVLSTKEQISDTWEIRGCLVKAVEAISEQEPVDVVVPINRIAEFIESARETEKQIGLKIISFGHAGDGNVHLCVLRGNRDEETWQHDKNSCLQTLYKTAAHLGGLTSGEHGIGNAKRPYFFAHTAETNLDLMRAIKKSLDPKQLLNDHISYLK